MAKSVKGVYETLQSKKFLEELFSEMISDMKQKPSYIWIKEQVEQIVTEKSDCIASASTVSELLKKKTSIAEVSMLGHTIDTVITKVLFKKLQKEYATVIVDMIDEFKMEPSTENGDHGQIKNASTKELSAAVGEKAKITFNESDSESDVSDCKFSICTVSSVHTSDLSSYDDEVSISSDDGESGTTKKKMSVKEASERLFQNKLEVIHEIGKPAKRRKKDKNQKKPKLEDASSSTIDLPSRKSLPARVRKPNSKYSSEDILCPMKQFPNLEQSPVSASSSPSKSLPKSSPKEIKNSTPVRKRGRPRKNEVKTLSSNATSLQYNAATEDLSAIQNSNVTMKLQVNCDQRDSSFQSNDSQTTSSRKRKTAFTMFAT